MTVAHTSRVYDYLLGGTDNFLIDRQVAEEAFASYPGGVAGAKVDARSNRNFLKRTVTYLVREAGIRQFLDIGTGIPTDNTHAVAFREAPDSRVVYVDNDPIVLAHAHALLRETPSRESVDYVFGDVRNPELVLARAAETLDFDRPIGLVLIGLMHVVPDEAGAHDIVRTLVDAVPSGSYLALSQILTERIEAEMAKVDEVFYQRQRSSITSAFRPRSEVERFFDGTELVDPGMVYVEQWRNDAGGGRRVSPLYGGVGRKP